MDEMQTYIPQPIFAENFKINFPVYYQTWFIALLAFCWWMVFPPIIAIILIIKQGIFVKSELQRIEREINQKITPDMLTSLSLSNKIAEQEDRCASIDGLIAEKNMQLEAYENNISVAQIDLENIIQQYEKKEASARRAVKKAEKMRNLYNSMAYSIDKFFAQEISFQSLKLPVNDLNELEAASPSILLKLNCMDVKALRKAYRDNDKQISKLLNQYSARYTTKTNKAIYSLMVIGLRSELQNVLTELKYDKLDKCLDTIKTITDKYLKITADGNQSIAGTLTKFIGELEYLFINAAKIEYNYYVKKEQAKQEQMAIREQMRQEAAERKALEAERKKIENEEAKYQSEIDKIKEQLEFSAESDAEALNKRILELQAQLSDVMLKKEDILKLQNGKAGTVYVISNLGSFGEDVFKIGMTRRLEPQDRINELSSASVPFKFDVHSFIFSEDAVSLENRLHTILNNRRINKVNLRKEFFNVPLDELENIVNEIEPTAAFNRTMAAEEYRQSLSTDSIYTTDYEYDDEDDEESSIDK